MDIDHNSIDFVELDERLLWVDGESSFYPKTIASAILKYNLKEPIYCTELNNEIKQFNKISDFKIKLKDGILDLDTSYDIPEPYKSMDVFSYIKAKFIALCSEYNYTDTDIKLKFSRLKNEYKLFKSKNFLELLKVCIYIVETFESNNIVWGTGRGSACTSYILYVIGLHDVDSYQYDLDITEFLR